MKLCILFLSSMKWRSEHEQCMQWYEEQFTHIFVLHAHISRRYAWWSPYCLRHNDSCRKLSKRSFERSFVLLTTVSFWESSLDRPLYKPYYTFERIYDMQSKSDFQATFKSQYVKKNTTSCSSVLTESTLRVSAKSSSCSHWVRVGKDVFGHTLMVYDVCCKLA